MGSTSGREDLTASDSTHPALFIESKLRACHTTRMLHDATKKRAAKEGKVPVLKLFEEGRLGFLVVVHSDDLASVANEVGSGTTNREDLTPSDSTHPVLYIERRFRRRHTVRTLHDATKKQATKEGKVPVLALFDKNRPGFLVCIHSDDLMTVLAEYAAALGPDDRNRLDSMIRRAQQRSHAQPEAS
jgi:hypothetical protein